MQSAPQRIVALVGRPNVGKSAIFNRLIGRRMAIVHEEWGVTRDRLAGEADWFGRRFELIDTGGIGVMDNAAASNSITEGARRQVEVAMADAAVLLQVVDLTAGLTPLDEEVARLLHRQDRPVLIVANKADHPGKDDLSAEFSRLGFPVYPVSALHNLGFDELMDRVLPLLPDTPNPTAVEPLKVAVVGKPNAGKSSYINRLMNSDRVIVSEIPGTTRDSIEVPFTVGEGPDARHYLLIDTAGMRPRGKVKEAVEKYSLLRGQRTIERADVVVLVVDAAMGPSQQDKKIARMILDAAKGCVVLVNKWDLAEGRGVTRKEYEAALRAVMPFLDFAPILFVSSKTGTKVSASVEAIDQVAANVSMDLSTGVLNRVLQDAFDRRSPPMVGGRRLRLYYATQVGHAPIRLRLFVNNPDYRVAAHEAYLLHQLRARFGLAGAPLLLQFRRRGGKTDRAAP